LSSPSFAVANDDPELGIFTGHLRWYEQVESTNDIAMAWADAGGAEGLVAVAGEQTRGRGRFGRTWASPAGAGLYLSALLRPPASVVSLLTIAVGVAVAEGIEASTGLTPALKWPNDVCMERPHRGWAKLGGILVEAGTAGAQVSFAVAGIGVNVGAALLPEDVEARATSIEAELGRRIDRIDVARACLRALDARYGQLKTDGGRRILDAWRRLAAATFGRRVQWEAGEVSKSGVAENIDEDGALLVRTTSGQRRVFAGEVRWL
jgi:BirA family biotin operon repressor/biotin-[acetyl-CoA-carboxylase] ligase